MTSIDQHNIEIQKNLDSWNKKPLLREIYNGFYKEILSFLSKNTEGKVVEIGSGIGNFKSVYPECIATDIFKNPWVDQVESAYNLSFENNSISNLVLFDVFHHLKYPGGALKEFGRVLNNKGRVIIFDPFISVFGLFVYGVLHHERVALLDQIEWSAENGQNPDAEYYAAQGNATRVFAKNSKFKDLIENDWKIVCVKKYSAISYVLSGGFSKPSLYPYKMLSFVKKVDKALSFLWPIFATRTLIVLEKK